MNTREIALHVLLEVEKGSQSHLALADALDANPSLSPRERRFLRRLLQSTWENQMLLDYRIGQISKVPVNRLKPLIRCLLRMSLCQFFYMDSVPASAVCNEAVKLVKKARMGGLSGYVNGVLRTASVKDDWKEEPEEIAAGIPAWILEKWTAEQGAEACRKMCAAFHEEPGLYVRRIPGRISREEFLSSLEKAGVRAVPAPFPEDAWRLTQVEDLTGLEAFRSGWISIQDISSMLVGEVADPPADGQVLDVCAAPGGKSIRAAEKVPEGRVISCDLSEGKAARIRENAARIGCGNLEALVRDARVFVPGWEKKMDLVLADLPCSGLGVLSRKPDIRFRITQEKIRDLQQLQREILSNVSRYVRPGGCLLYSTCTVTDEENRQNREWILSELPFRARDISRQIPESLKGALSRDGGSLQLLPGVHPCDGFYIAAFTREEEP